MGDVPAVLAIAESSSPWAPQYPVGFYRQVVEAQYGEPLRRRLLVSAGSDGITGFAVVAVLTTVAAEAELESLAVAPSARGKGRGEALLHTAIAWAEAEMFRLEVRAQNNAAIRLYRRCGFEDVAVRRGYYTSPADDALCMQLPRGIPPAQTAGVALL